jgi:hypothetical protein
MNKIYLVQKLPYENWETITHFNRLDEADVLCDLLIDMANNNPLLVANYRVHAVDDTSENRKNLA